MKKVIIGVLVVVLVIIAGVFIAINIEKDRKSETTSTNPENNTVANTTDTNKGNNIVQNNNLENNSVENNTTEENNGTEGNGPVDEEKAIEIVKDEWGMTDGYEFIIDYKNNDGEYIIAVRDSNTTRVMERYVVNAETGKCSTM